MRRSLVPVLLIVVLAFSGCAAGPVTTTVPEPTDSATQSNPNADACTDLVKLWNEVEEWGTTPGNTEADGRPTSTASAPDFRLELDEIRQTTEGTLRTTLDEYFEETPTQGTWWYANGIHGYGYAHAVGSACEAEGVTVNLG